MWALTRPWAGADRVARKAPRLHRALLDRRPRAARVTVVAPRRGPHCHYATPPLCFVQYIAVDNSQWQSRVVARPMAKPRRVAEPKSTSVAAPPSSACEDGACTRRRRTQPDRHPKSGERSTRALCGGITCILAPPCICCVDNHYTGRRQDDFNVQG